jgi:zinc and cadmium transporter
MSEYEWLLLYCALILTFSLGGGYLPFLGKITHNRLQFYLSLSAGVMLGASFFHVMPDAFELCKGSGWWMSLGCVGLFCIERFIAPHSHELDAGHHDGHNHQHKHNEGHSPHDHASHGGEIHAGEHRAAAPPVAGWMAVVGLTIHTFMNGVALAGAVLAAVRGDRIWIFPGIAVFLAIVLHKPADALAISTVLTRKGVSRRKLTLVQLGFGAMVPVGAVAFLLTEGAIETSLRSQVTGAALAFSAGTFLFIALSDLLPEVQFHRHDRLPLFATLLAGLVFMGFIAYLEPEHAEGDKEPAAAQKLEHGGGANGHNEAANHH